MPNKLFLGINFVRNKRKPYFVQMDTYRYKEHCGPSEDDHLKYRNSNEVKFWQNKDPINYAKKLMKKNKISEANIKKIEKQFDENLVGILEYLLNRKKNNHQKK